MKVTIDVIKVYAEKKIRIHGGSSFDIWRYTYALLIKLPNLWQI